jgi:hypothetical protein
MAHSLGSKKKAGSIFRPIPKNVVEEETLALVHFFFGRHRRADWL